MENTSTELNIQTGNKMLVRINHLFDHFKSTPYFTVVELESSEELTSDEYATLEDAEQAAFKFIKANADRYEPQIQTFSPITRAYYEFCVSELIDAGVIPLEFGFTDEANDDEEIEWDADKCWNMLENLGLFEASQKAL